MPEATFFLGESYLNRTRYREAAEHYLTVTSKYLQRVPRAGGHAETRHFLARTRCQAEACGTFDQVPKKYPKASPAIRRLWNGRKRARAMLNHSDDRG